MAAVLNESHAKDIVKSLFCVMMEQNKKCIQKAYVTLLSEQRMKQNWEH